MANNIVTATFNASHFAVTPSIYRYNYGNILVFEGIENLPTYFEVHFANRGDKTTTPWLGQDGQVTIPDDYLQTGKQIVAYIYLHETAADGETVYKVLIPVRDREEPEDVQPTPEQQSALDAAIEALNTSAQEAAESAESAEASAVRAEEAAASIDEGMIADAVADYLDEHPITVDETDPTVPSWAKQENKPTYTASEVGALSAEALPDAIDDALAEAKESGLFDGPQGPQGEQGIQGIQGPKGNAGEDGEDGISPVTTITAITGGHRVTIADADHPQGQSFDVMDGAKGDKGDTGDTGPKGDTGDTGPQGPTGPAYTLTAADKAEIVDDVLDALPTWTGGSY